PRKRARRKKRPKRKLLRSQRKRQPKKLPRKRVPARKRRAVAKGSENFPTEKGRVACGLLFLCRCAPHRFISSDPQVRSAPTACHRHTGLAAGLLYLVAALPTAQQWTMSSRQRLGDLPSMWMLVGGYTTVRHSDSLEIDDLVFQYQQA